jgi:Asp-tRNAAsn/Glu-tRNAGln amidotransferase A subunit and related amidases
MKLWPASLQQTALLIREGKLLEIIDRAMAAHEAFGASLNAYKTWDGARMWQHAEALQCLISGGVDLGPLMGIPISVKDLYGVPGLPVYAGTSQSLPDNWSQPGPVVAGLLSQMAMVTGKTHTVEFAFGGLGVNNHWGTPKNPWARPNDPRVPGGSSSGAGVSLLEGSAMLALGTDTAGSVRIPASFTGMVGLKTTFSRWSNQGIVPLSTSLDTPGVLARSVGDVAFAFSVIDGQGCTIRSRGLTGLRIGVPRNFFLDDADESIAALYNERLEVFERAGAFLVDLEVPGCSEVFEIFKQGGLAAAELRSFLDRHFPEKISSLDPVVKLRVESAHEQSAIEYLRRREELASRGVIASALFDTCDVIATPTVAISPPKLIEIEDAAAYAQLNMKVLRNTVIANLFSQCALTLPIGLDGNGMPVGMQLTAAPFAEEALLAAGMAVENKIGRSFDLIGTPADLNLN